MSNYRDLAVAQARERHQQITRVRHAHPDWPECAARCGWPVNPAALIGGFSAHPNCDRKAAA